MHPDELEQIIEDYKDNIKKINATAEPLLSSLRNKMAKYQDIINSSEQNETVKKANRDLNILGLAYQNLESSLNDFKKDLKDNEYQMHIAESILRGGLHPKDLQVNNATGENYEELAIRTKNISDNMLEKMHGTLSVEKKLAHFKKKYSSPTEETQPEITPESKVEVKVEPIAEVKAEPEAVVKVAVEAPEKPQPAEQAPIQPETPQATTQYEKARKLPTADSVALLTKVAKELLNDTVNSGIGPVQKRIINNQIEQLNQIEKALGGTKPSQTQLETYHKNVIKIHDDHLKKYPKKDIDVAPNVTPKMR